MTSVIVRTQRKLFSLANISLGGILNQSAP